ncbi:recombination mediator RecR [Rickettsiaceae bacterium]|nr:recombination mediator RecR [Rickettsiaceae bacterium]
MRKINGPDQLIYLFSKLPGLGQRSARRIVLHLLQDKDIRLKGLIEGLTSASDQIHKCLSCGNIDYSDMCNICRNEERSSNVIAIVDSVAELWAIERGDIFDGKYHVLDSISSANSINPEDLRLPGLAQRCKENNVEELIIATNSTLDGQTTAYFISEYFKGQNIKISRLASGVPIGGELDYLDEGTLSAALQSRREFG